MSKTNRIKFLEKFNLPKDTSLSLNDISSLSGMPHEALQNVYNRGIGAWKNSPSSIRMKSSFDKNPKAPRTSKIGKEQWAFGRVYAFVMKTDKVYYGADDDIRKQFKLQ